MYLKRCLIAHKEIEMEMFKNLAELMMATEASPLILGGIEFWIDKDGPFAGVLSYNRPTSKWNHTAINADIVSLSVVYPEVRRMIIHSFAGI
jgi:hypothetical protein